MTRNEARLTLAAIVVALISLGCYRPTVNPQLRFPHIPRPPINDEPVKPSGSIEGFSTYQIGRPPVVPLPVQSFDSYGDGAIVGKATLKTSSGILECDLIQETIRVLNEDTGLPVWGAEVRVKSLGVETYFKTDKNGYCEIVYAQLYASLRIRAHHCEDTVAEMLPRGTRTFTVHLADTFG